MNPPALTTALRHLPLAINLETDPNRAFWLDVQARLRTYRTAALAGTTDGRLVRGLTAPDLAKIPATAAVTHAGHARVTKVAINRSFTWAATVEGGIYWRSVYSRLEAHSSIAGLTQLGSEAKGSYCEADSEKSQLKQIGLIMADFSETALWYRPGQFPHHDPANPELCRYLPPGKPPLMENFITAKPGKFLTTYYSDALSTTEIAALAAAFRTAHKPSEVKFAVTADEIARVYRDGPSSCMANGKCTQDGMESVRAYASPDLAIAYIERNGKPTARALVRPSEKIYGRLYGDADALGLALSALGYKATYGSDTLWRAWVGARMVALKVPDRVPASLALEQRGEPVCLTPYFDSSSIRAYYDPEDGYLHLIEDGQTPTGRAKHILAGGHSIWSLPADPANYTYHKDYGPKYVSCKIGGSGNNTADWKTFEQIARPCPETAPKPLASQVAAYRRAVGGIY